MEIANQVDHEELMEMLTQLEVDDIIREMIGEENSHPHEEDNEPPKSPYNKQSRQF